MTDMSRNNIYPLRCLSKQNDHLMSCRRESHQAAEAAHDIRQTHGMVNRRLKSKYKPIFASYPIYFPPKTLKLQTSRQPYAEPMIHTALIAHATSRY